MLGEAIEFFNSKNLYNYNCDFKELGSNKGNIQFKRLCRKLADLQFDIPNKFNYQKVSLNELKEIVFQLYSELLGNYKLDEIKLFNSLLETRSFSYIGSFEYFESVIGLDVPTGEVNCILTSDKLYSIQALAVSHEYMHGFLRFYEADKFNDFYTNFHYHELLSNLIEFILENKVASLFPNDDIIKGHRIIRFSHDKESAIMYSKIFSFPLDDKEKEYINHVTYENMVSDVYAVALKEKYLENPSLFVQKLKELLDCNINLGEFLKYYDIKFGNNETINAYSNDIMKLEKKSK